MTEPKKERKKLHKFIILIPTIVFLAFIYFVMIRSFPGGVKDAIAETDISLSGFGNLSNTFEDVLAENLYGRYDYVNLNGLTTKILGINSLNERQKLKNGYLAYFEDIKDIEYAADNVIELNDFLKERDIDFLYVLAPSSASFYDAEAAPGYSDDSWQNIDAMIDAMDKGGVDNIDMDAWFEENGWTMEDVYFKTDHHWLPQASFQAAKLTMEYLSDQGVATYDPETLDEDNWTVDMLEDWFLGSYGKRTGTTYAGVDDFPAYFPNFSTDYTYSYLDFDSTNWVYQDTPLKLSFLDEKDYFNDGVHQFYLFGDYPLRITTNTKASCDKTLLLIGDSYRRAYEYFLSTQFQEVYGIDLRYYNDGTLAQYIEELNPDIVVMCTTESELDDQPVYNFEVSSYETALEETNRNTKVIDLGSYAVEAPDDDNNTYVVISAKLEPEQTYTLTVDSTSYTGGEDQYVQMTLQDLTTDTAIYNRYFDANSEEIQRWIFTVPEDEDDYAIYFYAGTKGHAANVSAEVTNVQIRKGIFED